jgi:fumarate hydratase class II
MRHRFLSGKNSETLARVRFRWGRSVIRALGIVKKCAALANLQLKQLQRT